MGSIPKQSILSTTTLTTSYTAGATTTVLNVGGSDHVTFLIDLDASGLTTFNFKFLGDGYEFFRVDSNGNSQLDEVVHSVAASAKFAVRVNTRGVQSLEMQMKADAAGTINAVEIIYEGTDNTSPTHRTTA